MKRKIVSVFLALCMALMVIPLSSLSVFASTSGDFEYDIYSESEKTCVIVDYKGSAEQIVIPSSLDGYTVIAIDSLGGYHFNTKSVFIPETVKNIYGNPFSYCTELEIIQLAENNVDFCIVNDALFSKDMKYLYAYPAQNANRKQFVIPENTEVIEAGAFEYSQLENIYIPNTVMSIGGSAFSDCYYLKSIKIPESITNLNSYMFYNCENLTEIILPNTLENIGRAVLYGTPYYNNAENWDNGLLYYGDYLLDADENLQGDVILKSGTKVVAEAAFLQSTEITSIEIPNGVKYLQDDTFGNCCNLERIIIPESITYIAYSAFWSCDKVTVYGYRDSEAELYTGYKNIPFIALPKLNLDESNKKILNVKNATVENTIISLRQSFPEAEKITVLKENGIQVTDLSTPCENGMNFVIQLADSSTLVYSIQKYISGDINGDGKVSAIDARIALQYNAGNKSLTAEQLAAADVNGDGKVSAIDARWILQAVAGNRTL